MIRALPILLALLGADAAEPALPAYPGAPLAPIGGEIVTSGEHFRLAYFTTSDSLPRVARHFLDQWRAEGLPVSAEGDFVAEAVVSAFHTREGILQAVVLQAAEGTTLGFSVLKDLRRWSPPQPGIVHTEAAFEGGSRSEIQREEGPPEEVFRRLEAQLLARGFTPSHTLHGEGVAEFVRGTEAVVLTVHPLGPGESAVSLSFSTLPSAGGEETSP